MSKESKLIMTPLYFAVPNGWCCCSVTGKVPNCSDNIPGQNCQVSNITGSLWVLGPSTNTPNALLWYSVLSPAQGTADQSWHLTALRSITVSHSSHVQETAQVVKEWEVLSLLLKRSFIPALVSPGVLLVTTLSLCRGFQKTTPTMVTWKFHKKPKKATLKVVVEKQVTMTKNKWRKCQKTATIILYPSTQLHRMNCPKKKLQGSHFSPNTFGWNICGVIFYWARFSIQNLKNPKAKSSYF